MGDAHRGIRGVHALTARTRRLEGVDTDIGVRNIDVIGGFHERNHLDRGEGCLTTALVIERRNAHQTMCAALDR